jgi:FHA domain
MPFDGCSRQLIARRLSAAYAAGLLSEDTYVGRVEELLGSALIDPSRLSGDLNFRRPQRTGSAAIVRAVRRVRGFFEQTVEAPALLALDWNGGTTEISVGRHAGSDVVLPAPGVSRRHAQLCFRDGRWILRDLESMNGTFVNGVRVGRCEVRPGDRVSFSDTHVVID